MGRGTRVIAERENNSIDHILFASPLSVIVSVIEEYENKRQSGDFHQGTNCTAGMGATWWYNSNNKRINLHTSSV